MRHFEDQGIKKGRIQNLVLGKTDNPVPLLKLISPYIYQVRLNSRFQIATIDLEQTYQDWADLERFAEIDRDFAIATSTTTVDLCNQPNNGKIVGGTPLPDLYFQPVNSLLSLNDCGGDRMARDLRGVGGLIQKVLCEQGMTFEEFRSFTLFVDPEKRDRLVQIVEQNARPDELECANLSYAFRRITGDSRYTHGYILQVAEQNALIAKGQEHHEHHLG